MKTNFQSITKLLAVSSLIAVLFAGCKPENPDDGKTPETKTTTIKADPAEMTVEAAGGDFSFYLNVENAIENAVITPACEADWIGNISYDKGIVSFTVSPAEEARETKITVEYTFDDTKLNAECTINQKGKEGEEPDPGTDPVDATIEIKVLSAKSGSPVIVKYTPSDENLIYITMVGRKEYIDGLGSDEAVYKDDMEYIKTVAEENGLPFDLVLAQLMIQGTQEIQFGTAPEEVPYYAYAYGIGEDGNLCTTVFKEEFIVKKRNTEPTSDIKFTYEVTLDAYYADFKVTPSDMQTRYYVHNLRTSWLDENFPGMTLEEQIPAQIEFMLSRYASDDDPITPSEFMEKFGTTGIYTRENVTLDIDEEYVIYAVVFDEEGLVISEISYEKFTPTRREPTDFDVTFKIIKLGSDEVTIKATPSDETVKYYWNIIEASKLEPFGDDIVGYWNSYWANLGIDDYANEYLFNMGSYGTTPDYPYSVESETEYRIYYVSFDDKTGDIAKVGFGKNFTTL